MPQQNTRYVKLESIGSALDTYTLDMLPLNSDDTIRFEERCDIRDVINPDVYENLSNEDALAIKDAVSIMRGKVKRVEIEFKNIRGEKIWLIHTQKKDHIQKTSEDGDIDYVRFYEELEEWELEYMGYH